MPCRAVHLPDGDATVSISHSLASSDGDFDGLSTGTTPGVVPGMTVTIEDNDEVAIVLAAVVQPMVVLEGGVARYGVALGYSAAQVSTRL